ncbi:hypothetical protein CBR_g30521 [Chara braunii]|uniref:Glycosyltransferase family 92 protein n=1 Tax=Chara braunii TaxID=69332 RepID=A0A388LD68_CHABU|nr:hypothetical protein CBR_g30521 [Chara braunii]|eukprot:GBG80153.1 hypothetical protein CBR_g30521 [Chara braunii]
MAAYRGHQPLNGANSSSSRVICYLTVLPIFLAAFAFFLSWKGEYNDPNIIDKIWADGEGQLDSPIWRNPPGPSNTVRCETRGGVKLPTYPQRANWRAPVKQNPGPKISVTTSTSGSVEQLVPWILYHKTLGVDQFYLFAEGKAAAPNATSILRRIKGVKVIVRDKELEELQARSRIWNETWLSSFFYRPCNYELFVKQTLNMEMAIAFSREAGMDWILHIDTDELMWPAGVEDFSLKKLFHDVDPKVDTIVFPNYESAIEREDIKHPFTEVTLFKKNYDHVPREVYFGHYKEATRDNPNYFLTYGNGKSAARIIDGLRPNGAHRFHNYIKPPNEIKHVEGAVLHYTYCKFSDVTSRRDRCGCKPTKEDTKRCFMLEFDREAFIIAKTRTIPEMFEWYKKRVVWYDAEAKDKLIRRGLFMRIFAPQLILRGYEETGMITKVMTVGDMEDEVDIPGNNRSDGATDREELGTPTVEGGLRPHAGFRKADHIFLTDGHAAKQ